MTVTFVVLAVKLATISYVDRDLVRLTDASDDASDNRPIRAIYCRQCDSVKWATKFSVDSGSVAVAMAVAVVHRDEYLRGTLIGARTVGTVTAKTVDDVASCIVVDRILIFRAIDCRCHDSVRWIGISSVDGVRSDDTAVSIVDALDNGFVDEDPDWIDPTSLRCPYCMGCTVDSVAVSAKTVASEWFERSDRVQPVNLRVGSIVAGLDVDGVVHCIRYFDSPYGVGRAVGWRRTEAVDVGAVRRKNIRIRYFRFSLKSRRVDADRYRLLDRALAADL